MRNPIGRRLRERSYSLRRGLERIWTRLARIPAVQLVVRTGSELGADDASHMAAGIAYYGFLSLFPLILGLIAIFGLFLPSETVQQEVLGFFEQNLPGAIDVLERNIENIIRYRGAIGGVSLVLLFWTASAMFGAISRAINRAWDARDDRPFVVRKARDLAMALGTGVLFLVSLGATSLFSILRTTDLPQAGLAADVSARVFAFLLSAAIFLILYKLVPTTRTYWRYVWPGALLAAVLFELAKTLFVVYLDRIADYESVYGSVSSVIILLLWIFISAFIVILGAEFSAEFGRMRQGVKRGVPIATPNPPP